MNRRQILQMLLQVPVVGAGLSGVRVDSRGSVDVGVASARPGSPSLLVGGTRPLVPAHGLLFGDEEVSAIRERYVGHPFFAPLREEIAGLDRAAERRFLNREVRLNDHLTDISRVTATAELMALHFLLADDEDAGRLAVECIDTLMRFPKWDFFLDGDRSIGVQRAPASTIAVALVSDWLGEYVSTAKRRQWMTVMAARGCEACYLSLFGIRNPREVVGWRFDPESTILERRPGNFTDMNRRPEITQTTNLRAIPACGLVFGAAAHMSVFGETPDHTRWVEMGAHAIDAFGDIFREDGSYHEGVSYANYTAEHIAQGMTVLSRIEGRDLRSRVNWKGYVDYVTNMSMPTDDDPYDVVNFGDNGNSKTGEAGHVARTAVPFWIARNFDSGRARWFGENLGGGPDIRSLLFHDDSVAPVAPEPGPQFWECDLDWVVARTGYTPDDLVVAMRSGPPANHEHADRNSIVVKCYGQQLVTDPYRPPYGFADPAWRMRLTEGHSAVLIDGRGHEHHNGVEGTNASQSWARIVTSTSDDRHAMWVSDASQPYRLVDLEIASVVRTVVVLFAVPAVVVVDRVTKHERPSTMQARFFGYNWDGAIAHRVTTNGFVVHRPGAVARVTCYSNAGVAVTTGRLPIPEERAQRHPFVQVETTGAATDMLMITAIGIGRTEAEAAVARIDPTSGGATVAIADHRLHVSNTHVTLDR